MELFLLLTIIYGSCFVIGKFLEKLKVPWIFAALLTGLVFSIFFKNITTETFSFLASLGMYFLLFLIGFEFDVRSIKGLGRTIAYLTLSVILLDVLFGSLLLIYFGFPALVAFIAALSLATIGEAVLIPIVEEFKLLKKKVGRLIVSVGLLDDGFEALAIIIVALLAGHLTILGLWPIILTLIAVLGLTYIFLTSKKFIRNFANVPRIEELFILALFILFLYLWLTKFVFAEILGAFLAGFLLRNFLTKNQAKVIEEGIKFIGYGTLAPLFFFYIGYLVDIQALINFPVLVISLTLVSFLAKLFGSLLVTRKIINSKSSFLLGVALSARFSTGLILSKILLDAGIINNLLFSSLVGSAVLLTISAPITTSLLARKWYKNLV